MFARSIAVFVVLFSLAACASEPQGLRLVETKSPVQLLRNEAWNRLPDLMIKGDSETSDVSIACDDDPQGRLRFWQSSTVALLNNSFAPRAITVADQLVASFAEQGWIADRAEEEGGMLTVLTKVDSLAVIEVEALSKTTLRRATVRITTSGPCVMTDGAESDEVAQITILH